MKILIVGDIHIAPYSSIIRSRGKEYSKRLENCIASINWCEKLAEEKVCDKIVYLGDTFDKPTLNDETLTAVKDIKWNKKLDHYFIVGNHESTENDLKYSSVKVLEGKNRYIIDKPDTLTFPEAKLELCFLPYITEIKRQKLEEYFPKTTNKRIIFSHNDLKGIQLGIVISKAGFELDEIRQNSDMWINGHLHNGVWVDNKIRNLGILTGKDFSENAEMYPHKVMILDTDTMTYEDVENPNAFNFYKLVIDKEKDLEKMSQLKDNSVLYISYTPSLYAKVLSKLEEIKNKIVEYRAVPLNEKLSINAESDIADLRVNHLQKLDEFCKIKFGDDAIIKYEIQEICK